MNKKCSGCGYYKPIELFTKNKSRKDGYNGECKVCNKKYRQLNDELYRKNNLLYKHINKESIKQKRCSYLTKNKDHIKKRVRENKLNTRYGITNEQYQEMYKNQGGKCLICLTNKEKLDIDHCHSTKIIRGLLCGNCNRALGLLRDDISVINNAIKYLKLYEQRISN